MGIRSRANEPGVSQCLMILFISTGLILVVHSVYRLGRHASDDRISLGPATQIVKLADRQGMCLVPFDNSVLNLVPKPADIIVACAFVSEETPPFVTVFPCRVEEPDNPPTSYQFGGITVYCTKPSESGRRVVLDYELELETLLFILGKTLELIVGMALLGSSLISTMRQALLLVTKMK